MKKIVLIITMICLFISCGSVSPVNVEHDSSSSSEYVKPYSSQNYDETISSSSSISQKYSSSEKINTALYVGEIGYVCNGFNTNAVSSYKATEGYMAMYNICGNRATMTTGTQPRAASVINDWLVNDLQLPESFRILIVNDVNAFGSTLRFYNAVDGYLRYIYVEPFGDGLGLMKKYNQ